MIKRAFLIGAACGLALACGQKKAAPEDNADANKSAAQPAPQPKAGKPQPAEFAGAEKLARGIVAALSVDNFKSYEKATLFVLPKEDVRKLIMAFMESDLDMIKEEMALTVKELGDQPADQLPAEAREELAEARAFLADPKKSVATEVNKVLVEMAEHKKGLPNIFDALRVEFAENGVNLKDVKVARVDLSQIDKPNTGEVKLPYSVGEVEVFFTLAGKPAELSLLLPVVEMPGRGWLMIDDPSINHGSDAEHDAYGENWSRNLEAAQAKAKPDGKLVFVDFTGSDWCPPCIALHKNVFTKKPFLDFAKAHLELVVLDFPKRKMEETQSAYNQNLSNKHKVSSFPTVIVMDAAGKVLHRQNGYSDMDAEAYVADLKKTLGL